LYYPAGSDSCVRCQPNHQFNRRKLHTSAQPLEDRRAGRNPLSERDLDDWIFTIGVSGGTSICEAWNPRTGNELLGGAGRRGPLRLSAIAVRQSGGDRVEEADLSKQDP
jgi:hypothetical protein